MTSEHLSEEELQLFAEGKLSPNAAANQHIQACASCKEELNLYRMLYLEISQQTAPVFDFDLSAAVMDQLTPIPAKASSGSTYGFIPAAIVAMVVIISLYTFRKNFINLSAGISFTFMAFSLVACMIIIGCKVSQEYQRYRVQIKKLNYTE